MKRWRKKFREERCVKEGISNEGQIEGGRKDGMELPVTLMREVEASHHQPTMK